MNHFQLVLIALFVISCGKQITQNGEKFQKNLFLDDPESEYILQRDMSLKFLELPLQGRISYSTKLWSGDSWPNNKGSLNYRWASENREGFNYLSPNYREVSNMPLDKLADLSPAEKFDLYLGNYDYPFKTAIAKLTNHFMDNWEGICHGWASATLHHEAPKAKIVKNPDGIWIPFGAPDIKALLSYAYAKELIEVDESYGLRCDDPSDTTTDRCNNDLPAHIFHAIITNKLGLLGQSFIIDIDPGVEVWNHPVMSYQAEVIKHTLYEKEEKVIMKMQIKYLDLAEETNWEASSSIQNIMTMQYELTLNKNKVMINSRWLSQTRPDFIWTIKKRNTFPGDLNKILELL